MVGSWFFQRQFGHQAGPNMTWLHVTKLYQPSPVLILCLHLDESLLERHLMGLSLAGLRRCRVLRYSDVILGFLAGPGSVLVHNLGSLD